MPLRPLHPPPRPFPPPPATHLQQVVDVSTAVVLAGKAAAARHQGTLVSAVGRRPQVDLARIRPLCGTIAETRGTGETIAETRGTNSGAGGTRGGTRGLWGATDGRDWGIPWQLEGERQRVAACKARNATVMQVQFETSRAVVIRPGDHE